MFLRIIVCIAALALMQTAAEARRVALVIGQNAYSELAPLDNPRLTRRAWRSFSKSTVSK
jgi:hypothetical protein